MEDDRSGNTGRFCEALPYRIPRKFTTGPSGSDADKKTLGSGRHESVAGDYAESPPSQSDIAAFHLEREGIDDFAD
jgi:hypothetical protein